ncbi:hypothetical protein GCM10025873_05350 [Demequina sediminis]|nr:hypothetical protein GCM10025873_05350 [Demequina sediminis]
MTDQSQLFPGKYFISTVLDALDTKTAMSGTLARVYLMRAAMAGGLIGVMYLAYYTVVSTFGALGDDSLGLGKMVGGLVFGFALVFIYYSKSELLTSNMMIVSIGAYYRRTTPSSPCASSSCVTAATSWAASPSRSSCWARASRTVRSVSRWRTPLITRWVSSRRASRAGRTCLCARCSVTS